MTSQNHERELLSSERLNALNLNEFIAIMPLVEEAITDFLNCQTNQEELQTLSGNLTQLLEKMKSTYISSAHSQETKLKVLQLVAGTLDTWSQFNDRQKQCFSSLLLRSSTLFADWQLKELTRDDIQYVQELWEKLEPVLATTDNQNLHQFKINLANLFVRINRHLNDKSDRITAWFGVEKTQPILVNSNSLALTMPPKPDNPATILFEKRRQEFWQFAECAFLRRTFEMKHQSEEQARMLELQANGPQWVQDCLKMLKIAQAFQCKKEFEKQIIIPFLQYIKQLYEENQQTDVFKQLLQAYFTGLYTRSEEASKLNYYLQTPQEGKFPSFPDPNNPSKNF